MPRKSMARRRPLLMDPGDVEDDGERGETHAERDEERSGSAAAGEVH